MKRKTLKKCIRHAKAFSRQYHGHPKFDGYTESEVATGGTVALAIFKDYENHKHAGRLPLPNEDIDRLYTAIGLDDMEKGDFDRVMNVCEMLLDLLKVNTKDEQTVPLADVAALIDSEAERTGKARDELISLVWQAVEP